MHKQTPKSCGCASCKAGKSSPASNAQRKAEERGARRATKQALKRGNDEIILPAQRGGYTD